MGSAGGLVETGSSGERPCSDFPCTGGSVGRGSRATPASRPGKAVTEAVPRRTDKNNGKKAQEMIMTR